MSARAKSTGSARPNGSCTTIPAGTNTSHRARQAEEGATGGGGHRAADDGDQYTDDPLPLGEEHHRRGRQPDRRGPGDDQRPEEHEAGRAQGIAALGAVGGAVHEVGAGLGGEGDRGGRHRDQRAAHRGVAVDGDPRGDDRAGGCHDPPGGECDRMRYERGQQHCGPEARTVHAGRRAGHRAPVVKYPAERGAERERERGPQHPADPHNHLLAPFMQHAGDILPRARLNRCPT